MRSDFIDEAAVDVYNAEIRAANAEAERKAAAGEPLTRREKSWIDLRAWGERCWDHAIDEALKKLES